MNRDKNSLLNAVHRARNAHMLEVMKKQAEMPPLKLAEVMEQYDCIRAQSSLTKPQTKNPKLLNSDYDTSVLG